MDTPTDWQGPVFLMNFPLTVSNTIPNNAWMSPETQGKYDKIRAANQWLKLFRRLSTESLIYTLPSFGNFQDLPFVANLGCYLPHIKDRNIILLANFSSIPRRGEEKIGRRFFESFDYLVEQPVHRWEGEADLKWVRENIYIGGIGSRSTIEAYDWMHKEFEMEIPYIELFDPKLYHLDCVYFQLTDTKALVNVTALRPQDVKKLERLVEIVPVPEAYKYEGWTNSLRVNDSVLHGPSAPVECFDSLLEKHDFQLETIDLTEFDKSGADLSCLCMHLNHKNRL
jgi:N-dimethylarginine dimethylaminohydrolase